MITPEGVGRCARIHDTRNLVDLSFFCFVLARFPPDLTGSDQEGAEATGGSEPGKSAPPAVALKTTE